MTTNLEFTINGKVRNIQFVGNTSLFRVWITGEEHGGLFGGKSVKSHGTCMGVIHAFTDMVKVHRYNFHVPGLHLRPTTDTLVKNVVMENVGYVSNRYEGDIPVDGMHKLADTNPLATTWGTVNFANGRLSVGKKIENREAFIGEAEYVTHERKAIHLMTGFDALLTGMSFDLRPVQGDSTSETTGEVFKGATKVSNELQKALQILEADQAGAREMISQGIAKKEARRSFAQATVKVQQAIEEGQTFNPGLTTVLVIKNQKTFETERMPVDVLANAVGYLFKGRFTVSTLQALDNPVTQAMIKKDNLSVLIHTA